MEKVHIEHNTVQETLIIPLYARKLCTEQFPNLFQDKKAVELIESLDYDFSEIEKKNKKLMRRFGTLEVAMRQNDLMIEIKDYLKRYPKSAVVNLGCGLDQTAENCDNGVCKIYNIDYKDVISVRNKLLPEKDRIKNIPADLNTTDWFDLIDASEGVIFFAAGVFYYFKKEQIKSLFLKMAEHFPGGRLVFDTAGKKAVKLMIKTWLKDMGITDINSFFYVDNIEKDIAPWLKNARISSKGYMLGYNDLKDKSVNKLFRLLAKIGDNMLHMQIVKLDFEQNKVD